MSRSDSVAVVIAAYNARERIAEVITGAFRHVQTVIVADDGSTDGTAQVAKEAGAEVIVLSENRGKGNALRVLFAEARRRGLSAVIALDADGQHDPDDIPAFLGVHRDHPDAILTGSRMGAPERIPRHRRNSMVVARFFISLAANQFIEDTQCGFRLYPLSALEALSLHRERYVTETEILLKAGDSGRAIRSLPIKALYPPGHPTHFRSVPDVAAISVYVISYLMVKWGVEGLRPGVVNTYRGAGTARDRFSLSPGWDRAFEVFTLCASLPLTMLYGAWYYLARWCGLPVLQSLARSEIPVGRLLLSVLLLPGLLAVSIVDLLGNRLGMRPDLTTGFVRRYYPNPWTWR
jgi:glycosyltransferase involved in cell wall biosynthesis